MCHSIVPSIPVYEVFSTPFFSFNISYQIHNLPRYTGIDYENNQSLSWCIGDNNINTCNFGKITFCHVLPSNIHQRIEHACLNDSQEHTCSYIESPFGSPYLRNIHDNIWIISVSNYTYCLIAQEQNDGSTQMDDIIIERFAVIRLPCKSTLNCKFQISLRNTNCQSSIEYYITTDEHYSRNDKLLELLNTNTFDDAMLLGFVV
ncbi:unnamed protein product [Didymodactylos carnosus]|uniref:Uncharacterized protein n=1 Tax=Didymodactylos carnosus TaxID=1234261 RepID=A0A8S2EWK2_9BILA|nr:unnamed protein product [Didymodactylos carnosus]CAF4139955.1 unnamed protein product [Didymodactylos carnosus]